MTASIMAEAAERLTSAGMLAGGGGPEALAALVASQTARVREAVRVLG
jgi:hypothetical protein